MIGARMLVVPGPVFEDLALERAFQRDGWVVVDLLHAEEVARLARVFQTIAGTPEEPIYSSWSQALAVRAATDEAIRAVTLPRLGALLPGYAMVFAGFMAKAVGPETASRFTKTRRSSTRSAGRRSPSGCRSSTSGRRTAACRRSRGAIASTRRHDRRFGRSRISTRMRGFDRCCVRSRCAPAR